MCNVQSTKFNVHSTNWGSVIEIAPLMMSSPVCKEVTFVNSVTSDDNLSQTQSIFGPSTTNLWHVMGLSRRTEQVTQIDRRTCGSTFTNTHVLTIEKHHTYPKLTLSDYSTGPTLPEVTGTGTKSKTIQWGINTLGNRCLPTQKTKQS
jgi:hypothetical protein